MLKFGKLWTDQVHGGSRQTSPLPLNMGMDELGEVWNDYRIVMASIRTRLEDLVPILKFDTEQAKRTDDLIDDVFRMGLIGTGLLTDQFSPQNHIDLEFISKAAQTASKMDGLVCSVVMSFPLSSSGRRNEIAGLLMDYMGELGYSITSVGWLDEDPEIYGTIQLLLEIRGLSVTLEPEEFNEVVYSIVEHMDSDFDCGLMDLAYYEFDGRTWEPVR